MSSLISKIDALNNGSKATAICADLRNPDSPQLIVSKALQFGQPGQEPPKIDILVNNAGVDLTKNLGSIELDDFAYVFNLNVRAPVLLMEAVLPHLRHSGGSIINISSVSSRSGFSAYSLYCSSKAAIEGLTRSWAGELGPEGIRVNCVSPGPVETEMIERITKELVEKQKGNTPLEHRMATVEDIALVVAWLAGPDSRWVTGQTISATGGLQML